jgi:hypothetical protein
MKRSPLLARADLLRALALAGDDEDDSAATRLCLLRACQPVVATISGNIVAAPLVRGRRQSCAPCRRR